MSLTVMSPIKSKVERWLKRLAEQLHRYSNKIPKPTEIAMKVEWCQTWSTTFRNLFASFCTQQYIDLFAIITGIWELSFLHGRILKLSHNTLRCTLTLAAPNKIEESRGFPVKQRSFMSNQAADWDGIAAWMGLWQWWYLLRNRVFQFFYLPCLIMILL